MLARSNRTLRRHNAHSTQSLASESTSLFSVWPITVPYHVFEDVLLHPNGHSTLQTGPRTGICGALLSEKWRLHPTLAIEPGIC